MFYKVPAVWLSVSYPTLVCKMMFVPLFLRYKQSETGLQAVRKQSEGAGHPMFYKAPAAYGVLRVVWHVLATLRLSQLLCGTALVLSSSHASPCDGQEV